MKRLAFASVRKGGSGRRTPALQDSGASVLRFGGRILRAETAVLVGLTLLQHEYGDL